MAIEWGLQVGGVYLYPGFLKMRMWSNSAFTYWKYKEEEWYKNRGNAKVIRCIVRALDPFLPRQNISDIVLTCFLYEWAIIQASVLISLEPFPELTTWCNCSSDKVANHHCSLLPGCNLVWGKWGQYNDKMEIQDN